MRKMRDIVIPYVHKKASADELKYAIRSIEKNFKSPFRIIVIGDLPSWANDDLKRLHIPTKLISGIPYCHCLDVNSKMKTLLQSEDLDESFIYTYDDIIFIAPVEYSDIAMLKADSFIESAEFIQEKSTGSRKWNNLLTFDFNFLSASKFRTYNYETHLPRMFQKNLLMELFSIPELQEVPFLFSTLYYNMFFKVKPYIIGQPNCDIKTGVYEQQNIRQIRAACAGKKFLNFNNQGVNPHLFRFLAEMFPDKSSFEL
jgi:hypothetical protein